MDASQATYLSSSDSTTTPGSNTINVLNWSKMRSLSEELDWLQSFQSSSLLYPFEQSRHFIAYIEGKNKKTTIIKKRIWKTEREKKKLKKKQEQGEEEAKEAKIIVSLS